MAETLLNLIRLGIGHQSCALKHMVDWETMEILAEKQGLLAIVVDGIERLPKEYRPPQQILLKWIGIVLQNYEQRYSAYEHAIDTLATFYNYHGLKMMVLKGYACSLNWPKPEHRPCGDIDIWLYGQQKVADKVLSQERDIKIDTSEHHHTVFYWRGFSVENKIGFVSPERRYEL